MTYRRILVPLDGSRHSNLALDEAVQLAQTSGAIIYLCTIVTTSTIVPPGSLLGLTRGTSGNLQKRLVVSAKMRAEKLLGQKVQYCESFGIKAYPKVLVGGNIAQQILNVAKKKSVDLIVIGSQGLHGIAKLKSLGSISRKISEHASCPVLIVR